MCDYSLHTVASRPAKAADSLVSTEFRGSLTRGFAPPNNSTTAGMSPARDRNRV